MLHPPMKPGDLVIYDRFGTSWPSLSPSTIPDDFGIGLVLNVIEEIPGSEDDSCVEIMKDDGTKGFFSFSYLIRTDL